LARRINVVVLDSSTRWLPQRREHSCAEGIDEDLLRSVHMVQGQAADLYTEEWL
jgi:hypothetical protein